MFYFNWTIFIVAALCAQCSQTQKLPAERTLEVPLASSTKQAIPEDEKVPVAALAMAKDFLAKHSSEFPNQKYFTIIDYSQPSSAQRLYLVNSATHKVKRLVVAHGRGSDPNHSGNATVFSDQEGSKMTSLGIFKTGDVYRGSKGLALRLEGLSSTNRKAQARAIVIHGANYVVEGRPIQGRSWGCPVVEPRELKPLLEKIKGGSLILAWIPQK